MARIDTLSHFLTDIADKIRNKRGTNTNISAENFDTEIGNIKYKVHSNFYLFNVPEIYKKGTTSATSDTTTTTLDMKNIDLSNLTITGRMFYGLKALTSVDISTLTTTTNAYAMFSNCNALTQINFPTTLDTTNLTNMNDTFLNCSSLTTLDLSMFNTSNVTTFANLCKGCTNLETITFGNNFTFASAIGLGSMFTGDTKLDNNTLNAILHICTTVGQDYTGTKTLEYLGIDNTFDNFDNIPNLSNYTEFTNAGWTIS